MRDINALAPGTRAKARALVAALDAAGIRHAIIETRRTLATQRAYYAQGRESLEDTNRLRKEAGLWLISAEENSRIVTRTLNSRHLDGEAFDLVPLDAKGRTWWGAPRELWLRIGNLGESVGLEWGGRWGQTATSLGWDCPHFQDTTKEASV